MHVHFTTDQLKFYFMLTGYWNTCTFLILFIVCIKFMGVYNLYITEYNNYTSQLY